MTDTRTTRLRLIQTAILLFQRQGYHATGLTQILTESNTPKGSFYHHFPGGKEELAEAALALAGSSINDLIVKSFDAQETFEAGVKHFAQSLAKWFSDSNYSAGCPISSTLLEMVPKSDRLHAACHDVMSGWAATVTSYAMKHGHETNAQTVGTAFVLAIEGAWMMSRATQSTLPFETASKMIIGML